jgi:putative intracellular protease/amidase
MADVKQRALIVVTSHDRMGDTDKKTGFFYRELATPYWAFVDAGIEVDIASIKGGKAPADPGSVGEPGKRAAAVQRFMDDADAVRKIKNTLAIASVNEADYDLVFLPGGHGTMWDFPDSEALASVVGRALERGVVVGAVCHGPAGLIGAKRSDGEPVVKGRRVNSFTDAEEEAVGLAATVPFLLESRLRELGADFEGTENFQPYAVRDGNLVTGQNPPSSELVAEEVLAALRERATKAA